MPNPPVNRSRILVTLQECGPMTRHDLAEHLDWPLEKVSTTINSARHLRPGLLFRIVRYEQGVRVLAVFAAEEGQDAPRPPRNHKKRNKQKADRYLGKNRAVANAKNRLRNAAVAGLAVVTNPWLQLAPPEMRPTMTRVQRQEAGANA